MVISNCIKIDNNKVSMHGSMMNSQKKSCKFQMKHKVSFISLKILLCTGVEVDIIRINQLELAPPHIHLRVYAHSLSLSLLLRSL